ncbi:MAG TPA: hypothetical protein VJT67_04860 [Longimicrobiaceae bacterium]|nr:hypothetical protein [Longimicrobiaceae bacterium]
MPRLSMLLLLPLLAAGCTTTTPAAAPAPAPPPPMATMGGGFPMVTYTVNIADADIPAGASADMRGALVGAWVIAFGNNGHAMVSVNGRSVVDAPYTVSGNTLTLTEDSGEYACHSTGTYTWHATATELHLTKVNDPCDGRAVVLTAHALVRR